jgi:hypothetical protein
VMCLRPVDMWIFFGVFLSRHVSSTGICMLCILNFLYNFAMNSSLFLHSSSLCCMSSSTPHTSNYSVVLQMYANGGCGFLFNFYSFAVLLTIFSVNLCSLFQGLQVA